MKKYPFLVLLLAVLFAAGCHPDASVRLAGKWKLDRIESPDEAGTAKVTITKGTFAEKRDVVIDFADNRLEGFGGNTPTNTMAGKFRNVGGQQLEFVDYAIISRVAETPWGDAFSNRTRAVNAYSLRGNALVLHCGPEDMIFVRR
jgi:hypothetical protein